jgi:hypothetical protein
MIRRQLVRCLHIFALLVLLFAAAGSDGTGKFHMGRESAKMMPAQDAAWLERKGSCCPKFRTTQSSSFAVVEV